MTETGFENTRMERLQFLFPIEFEPYLSSPLSKTVSFQKEGDVKQEATRSKLMEFLAVDSGSPGSSSFIAASKSGHWHFKRSDDRNNRYLCRVFYPS